MIDDCRLRHPREEPRLYAAFASYASRWDSKLTGDVERFLEGLHANDLIPQEYRRRIEICRDSSDFPLLARLSRTLADASSSTGLRDIVQGLLKMSEHLIVFVRPESRSHPWIVQELELWLEMRGSDGIIVCLAAGDEGLDPKDLFPGKIVDSGIHEHLHIDLRGFGRRDDPGYVGRSYDEELLRLAARLLGPDVTPSALIAGWRARARERAEREAKERLRRNAIVAGAGFALIGIGGYLVNGAYRRATGVELAAESRAAASPATALRLALQAYPEAPDVALPLIQSVAGRLARPVAEYRQPMDGRYWDVPAASRTAPELAFRPDGSLILSRRGSNPIALGPGQEDARPVPGWNTIPEAMQGWRLGAISPSRRFLAGVSASSIRVVDRSRTAPVARPTTDFATPPGFRAAEIAVSDDGSAVAGLNEEGRLWASAPGMGTPCPFLPRDAADREPLLVASDARFVATGYRIPCGRSTCRRVVAIRPVGCERVFDRRYEEGDVRALALAAGVGVEPKLLVGMRTELRTVALGSIEPERSTSLTGDRSILVVSPDGRFMAAAGRTGDVSVLALDGLQEAAVVTGYEGIDAIAFSQDGTMLAVAGYEHGDGRKSAAYLIGISKLDVVPDYSRARWSRYAAGGPIDWVGSGGSLAVAGPDGAVVLDPATGSPTVRLVLPSCVTKGGSIQDVYGRASDQTLAALYMPSALVRWHFDGGRAECLPVGGGGDRPREVRLVDGESLVGLVRGRLIGLPGASGRPTCPDVPVSLHSRIVVSRRGRMLAWSDAGAGNVEVGRKVSAQILELTGCASASLTGWLPPKAAKDTRSVRGLAWDDTGARLAMSVGEGERTNVLVWTRQPCGFYGRCPRSWGTPVVFQVAKRFDELAISSDGRYLAARAAGSVEVRDLKRGLWLYAFDTGYADAVTTDGTLAFSPDGRFLAASFPLDAPLIRTVDEGQLIRDACMLLPQRSRPVTSCGHADAL